MATYKLPAFYLPNPGVYVPNYVEWKKAMQHFSPENCLIFIGNDQFEVSNDLKEVKDFKEVYTKVESKRKSVVPTPILDHVEPIYSTPFAIYKIPWVLYRYWSTWKFNKKIQVQPLNSFIPKVNEICYLKAAHDITPKQVSKKASVKAWIYPIIVMSNPLLSVNCEFRSLNFKNSLIHTGRLAVLDH